MSQIITDHEERAVELLERVGIVPRGGGERWRALIHALASRVQELEDLAFAVLTESRLPLAEGVHLERWGEIVGERRGAVSDDGEYRRLVNARLLANRSNAQVARLLEVAALLVLEDVQYQWIGTADYRLSWESDTEPSEAYAARLLALLLEMRPAGVQCSVVRGPFGSFRFDDGPGFDSGKLAKRLA